ncbi:MAG TPA: hypothetical protein VE225_04260, partial [Rubrobacteraceae bacterium]|nr:hypothetical protein [Rubrobacteraceae bacterium]
ESDLASEEPGEAAAPLGRSNGRADGQLRPDTGGEEVPEEGTAEPAEPGFDLIEDLTPYELRTICGSVADLREPASLVEIFGSIRQLDERGELELSQEEIREVIGAMLEAGYLTPTRTKPYKEAKADITFYALDRDREEVKAALEA